MRLKQVKCLENPFFNSTIDSNRKPCPPDQVKFNCFDGEGSPLQQTVAQNNVGDWKHREWMVLPVPGRVCHWYGVFSVGAHFCAGKS